MKRILLFLLTLWGYVWAAIWTLICGVIYIPGALFDRKALFMDFMQRFYCRGILVGIGVQVRVEGAENMGAAGQSVLMGNHTSYLDIPALVLGMRPLALRFVAKKELKVIPFLGWAIAVSHHIKIDRGNREQAVAELRKVAATIHRGFTLAIFPEGTRSPTRRLLPFKRGGFHLARETGLPILPVSIQGAQRMFGKKTFLFHPGTITVVIHPPVSVEGVERGDMDPVMNEVRRAILSVLPESAAAEQEI